jgi:microcystin-dependent protein
MEPFLGQITMFGFNFAPQNWAFCDGQLMSISQNTALFSLLGTMYGGDGQTTFGLPDLRGRVPIHRGQSAGTSNYSQGEKAGSEQVTLISTQMPAHTHTITPRGSTNTGGESSPANAVPAIDSNRDDQYDQNDNVDMKPFTSSQAGGSQPFSIVQPFQVVNFCIAIQGIFPSRN